jgi:hypothetical protein
MKNKLFKVFGLTVIVAVLLIGCTDPSDPKNGGDTSTFKAVTNITGIPALKQTDVDLTLTGTVAPSDATNKTIVWSIAADDNGSTNPSLEGNVLATEAEGTVKVLATIVNGLTATAPFTKTFTITVTDDEVTGCGCCKECEDECEGDCCKDCTCGVPLSIIDIASISGLIAPVTGEIPYTEPITETEQFTGTVTWNGNPSVFASYTVYTATITLTAKDGFTFDGLNENFFDVLGATTTTNAENSNIVTAVFPETGGTQSEELIAKWYTTQAAANANAGTSRYEFTIEDKLLTNGAENDFTFDVENDVISLIYQSSVMETAKFFIFGTTLTITETSGTLLRNGIYFKHSNIGTAIGGGDADFTGGSFVTIYNIHDAVQWEAARAAISTGGANRNYIININDTLKVSGANSYLTGDPPMPNYYSFGTTENSNGVSVSVRGSGTLEVNDSYGKDGALLTIRAGQKLSLHNVTLKGHSNNDDALIVLESDSAVTPPYAIFTMHSGKITGNTTTQADEYGNGGGVRNKGVFTKHGGEIRSNTANNGGGVFNTGFFAEFTMNGGTITGNEAMIDGGGIALTSQSKFTMNDGKISDNDASGNGGGVSVSSDSSFTKHGGEISFNFTMGNGGGVDNEGQFLMTDGIISGNSAIGNGGGIDGNIEMSGGIIYGTDLLSDTTTQNYAGGTGNSLNGTAMLGTFNGSFTPNTVEINTTDETIFVRNGGIIYSDIGDAPDYLLENAWYTTQENANDREGDYLEFRANGRIFKNGVYAEMIFTVSGTTLTVKSTSETQTVSISFADTGTGEARELKLTLTGGGSLLTSAYYAPNPDAPIKIRTASDWNAAINMVNGGRGSYTFNIIDSFSMGGITTTIEPAAGQTLHITVKGVGETRTIELISAGSIIRVGARVTLVLEENLVLQGFATNNTTVVHVSGEAALIMNDGVKITGNTSSGGSPGTQGGGVYVAGTFTMNGGEISGNTAATGAVTTIGTTRYADSYGGGVFVIGTFNMNGGKISGNTVRCGSLSNSIGNYTYVNAYGGGVFVSGTFNMKNAEISGNNATTSANSGNNSCQSWGGGVYSSGLFYMNENSVISGNRANAAGNNSGAESLGGGVFARILIMDGGVISGNTASASLVFGNPTIGGGGVWANLVIILNGIIYGNDAAELSNIGGTTEALYGTAIYCAPDDTVTEYYRSRTTINLSGGKIPWWSPEDPATFTPLSANVWTDGTISLDPWVIWYSFPVTAGTTYYIWSNTSFEGDGTKNGVIGLGTKYANGEIITGGFGYSWIPFGYSWIAITNFYTTPLSFTADRNGTVYVRVSCINPGTFAIAYNTTGVRP